MATSTATKDDTARPARSGAGEIAGLTLQTERGLTTVSDAVVAKIAGHACRQVDGVAGMGATFRRLLGRVKPGQESLTQGVNVEVGRKEAAVDLVIVVRYGYSIPALAQAVRENVITEVESVTGLIVKEVNVEIDDLVFDDESGSGSRVE